MEKKFNYVLNTLKNERNMNLNHIWDKYRGIKENILRTGEKNGMHRISVYDLWVKKYGITEANRRKEIRRQKLSASLKGKNKKIAA